MSRANEYIWEDLGQVVGPQGPAGPAGGGGSTAEKKDFSGGSYDPLSGQYTNKTKDQILNEVYTETDNGTNPKEYYGGISGVGDEALKEMFGVNDVAPNSMNYVDYHKDVKFDGKATEYGNLPYTNTFLFAVISGGNTTIYDSSDKTKRQCVVIDGAITASTTTMQELVVGAGGATVTLKDGENSTIPYVINGTTSESGTVTLNEGDVIHIKEYSNGTNYYQNSYMNVPYFMSTDTNCINDYLSNGLFAAPSGENGAISSVMVMAGSGMIQYTTVNYSYQKEYKFTCRYSDPNYNQKCVEATYGYATWDSTLHTDKLNPVKNEMPENYTVLNLDYSTATGDLMLKLVGDIANYDNICGYITLPTNAEQGMQGLYKEYLYGPPSELLRFVDHGTIIMTGSYIHYRKYKVLKDTILEIIFEPFNSTHTNTTEAISRKFIIDSTNTSVKRVDSEYVKKPQFKVLTVSSDNLSAANILNELFNWTTRLSKSSSHICTNLTMKFVNNSNIWDVSDEVRISGVNNYWRLDDDITINYMSSHLEMNGTHKVEGFLQRYDITDNTCYFYRVNGYSYIRFNTPSSGVFSNHIYMCAF